ncbi:V-type ATP synthase subunit E family protein [Sedimentibacter sp.]|uniref:V-type ATP synthase subunit E n=1 Tax=Sedimentibacter sp. TaxID=1960295 RepID=UPI00289A212E|nr:V-type ATP synthase subunit E family protein [Sedimentibacter sp.]
MSIENITAAIINDAKLVEETSVKNAEKTMEEIISKAKIEAEEIMKQTSEKCTKDAESLKSRKVSAAELQARKMILGAKQEAIQKSFDLALEKLKSMPEDKYLNYLTEEIIKIPANEGIIILNQRDRDKIGEKLIKAVNQRLNVQRYKLSDNTINASGGFLLRSGNIEINNTFETLLNSIRDDLTSEVANALFS